MDLSLPVEIVQHYDAKHFHQNYLITSKPALIKNGLVNDFPALKKWSFDFFKRQMGHLTVPVFDSRINRKNSALTHPDSYMNFAQFLHQTEMNESNPYRIFLFNIFRLHPSLSEDFPCPEPARGMLGKLGYMFFASRNTRVRLHYDIDMSHVFHTHFAGRKRVILFSQDYNELLYRLPLNTYSLTNIENENFNEYPALKFVKGHSVVMDPGDTLFIPAGYWHYMHYLDSGFSVSYRKLSSSWKNQITGLTNLTARMWIDKTMNYAFGNRWLAEKEKMARNTAERRMVRLGLQN
jgi:hypothetical protein